MIENPIRLHVTNFRDQPALDIPALEFATRELARIGERPEILLTHPENTLIRGFAEEKGPRRFAAGGTVYHGDTGCIHKEYDPDLSLSELEAKSKSTIYEVLKDVVGEEMYWYSRDLLYEEGDEISPETDPQIAGMALMNGRDYSTARACITNTSPNQEVEDIIREDDLTSIETYNELSYFLEEETGNRVEDLLEVEEDPISVETYLEQNGLKQDAYEAARDLQKRERGIEPRSCIADFRPSS